MQGMARPGAVSGRAGRLSECAKQAPDATLSGRAEPAKAMARGMTAGKAGGTGIGGN